MERKKRKTFERAREIFHTHNGILRTAQAKKLGIAEPILAQMYKAGLLVKESRGLYRLAGMSPLSYPDFVQVSIKVPNSVICLVSALNYHNLTTQIPYQVYIALPRAQTAPRFEYPPLNIIHLSDEAYQAGIEEYLLDSICVRIYCREKTVADCFKFRNKIGQDVALEALKDYLRQPERNLDKLQRYARIDRVEKVIRPYIEAAL